VSVVSGEAMPVIAQVARHLGGPLVALLGLLRQRALDDAVEARRDGGVDLAQRRMRRAGDAVHERERGVVRLDEGMAAGEHLEQYDAEREQIGARIGREAEHLLGRHVLGRAERGAGLRHARRRHVRHAEVGELGAPVRVQHDVRRLDVAMHDREALRVVERVGHLRHQLRGRRVRQALAFLEDLLQRAALEQLHRDVGDALVHADVVDGDDVGVVEAAGRARLAQEALAHLVHDVGRQVGQQRLDGHLALDERVDRPVHGAHRAAPELTEDPVTAEGLLHLPIVPYLPIFRTFSKSSSAPMA